MLEQGSINIFLRFFFHTIFEIIFFHMMLLLSLVNLGNKQQNSRWQEEWPAKRRMQLLFSILPSKEIHTVFLPKLTNMQQKQPTGENKELLLLQSIYYYYYAKLNYPEGEKVSKLYVSLICQSNNFLVEYNEVEYNEGQSLIFFFSQVTILA